MKGFLQVVSLFGLPLAILIWYDLFAHTKAYQFKFNSDSSRPVVLGVHLLTALLCLHTPLRMWRRFDPLTLRLFCVTVSLALFWITARLVSSGRIDQLVLLKSAAVFFIPIITYAVLSTVLFKLSRGQFDTDTETITETPEPDSKANSDSAKESEDHVDP